MPKSSSREKGDTTTPVFYDGSGIRWIVTRIFLILFISVFTFIFIQVAYDISNLERLPEVHISNIPPYTVEGLRNFSRGKDVIASTPTATIDELNSLVRNQENILGVTSPDLTSERFIMAFFVNWDKRSLDSLEANVDSIDILLPEWVHLNDIDGSITLNDRSKQVQVHDFVEHENPNAKITPVINNYSQSLETWDPDLVLNTITDPISRTQLIENLLEYVETNSFDGINVDFEDIPEQNQYLLETFMYELYQVFHEHGYSVSQSLPLDNTAINYPNLARQSDYLILIAYDEHWSASDPGPIASQSWYTEGILKRLNEIAPEKMVIALGNYGYDWVESEQAATPLTFQDIIHLTKQHNGTIDFVEDSLNPRLEYTDFSDTHHQVMFLDSVTIYNQIKIIDTFNPRGYALWRLGSEDPSSWEVFDDVPELNEKTVSSLQSIRNGYGVDHVGYGEIYRVERLPKSGTRRLQYDHASELIIDEDIIEFNSPYLIRRYGRSESKKIALTFDDGPDKEWTPQILDILKKQEVPGAFFIIGSKAAQNKDILQRMIDEGHEIGNHTYSHPDITKITPEQLELEVNATQRILESSINKRTLLFRAPYGGDSNPEAEHEFLPLETISNLGYYTVGMEIDPNDWSDITAKEIRDLVINHIEENPSNILLLHDGGGDRSETVSALTMIITELKEQGYEFVSVSDLLGVSRDEVMPAASLTRGSSIIDRVGFTAQTFVAAAVKILLTLGIIIGTTRLLITIVLAIVEKIQNNRRKKKEKRLYYQPLVSVLIPAFNEGPTIIKTVNATLRSNYENFEIIVIDDGSTDDTYQIAREAFKDEEKVKVYSTVINKGKSQALNFGLERTKAPYIVVLDGDTLLARDAIYNLVKRVRRKDVGAVAGNIKVGNRKNILGKLQALEYITSQNLDRRAADILNGITIVPGAVGAWKRLLVKRVGGFNSQTLAEDSELTVRILKQGYRVVYEENAIGYTEAPESIKNMTKQRFRWMFGRLQLLFKHRDLLFNYRYGFLGIYIVPMTLIFEIGFTLISPLIDFYFFISIIGLGLQRYFHPGSEVGDADKIIIAYIVFLAIDVAVALIALILERKEDFSLILWMPVQKYLYRWMYYFISFQVIFRTIKGQPQGWGKFKRTATAEILDKEHAMPPDNIAHPPSRKIQYNAHQSDASRGSVG